MRVLRGLDLVDAARRMKACAAFAGTIRGPRILPPLWGGPRWCCSAPRIRGCGSPRAGVVSVLETTAGLDAQTAAAAVFAAAKAGAVLSA